MHSADYKARTRTFAIAVIKAIRQLPSTTTCRIIGAQLLRSASSTAANYRAACRARSVAEFVAKLGTVVEEADESAFWLDLLIASGEPIPLAAIQPLQQEAEEIVAMTVASINTAARKLPANHPARRPRRTPLVASTDQT